MCLHVVSLPAGFTRTVTVLVPGDFSCSLQRLHRMCIHSQRLQNSQISSCSLQRLPKMYMDSQRLQISQISSSSLQRLHKMYTNSHRLQNSQLSTDFLARLPPARPTNVTGWTPSISNYSYAVCTKPT